MDYSPPGSSVHEILQARILERVAIPFSRESSWTRDETHVSWIAGRFFTIWATREAQNGHISPAETLGFIALLHIFSAWVGDGGPASPFSLWNSAFNQPLDSCGRILGPREHVVPLCSKFRFSREEQLSDKHALLINMLGLLWPALTCSPHRPMNLTSAGSVRHFPPRKAFLHHRDERGPCSILLSWASNLPQPNTRLSFWIPCVSQRCFLCNAKPSTSQNQIHQIIITCFYYALPLGDIHHFSPWIFSLLYGWLPTGLMILGGHREGEKVFHSHVDFLCRHVANQVCWAARKGVSR